jgi:hypothetical protein
MQRANGDKAGFAPGPAKDSETWLSRARDYAKILLDISADVPI